MPIRFVISANIVLNDYRMRVLDTCGAQLIVDLAFLQEPRGSAVHVGGLHEHVRQGRVLDA
jgi:hypothetical protein